MEKLEKPTISLCMIVKNESDLLGLCLQSVQGAVDELIVVDTGSTDNTKEIAEHFGAKVYDFPWTHDFSAARNFAIEQATCDWILQLDADEHLNESSQEQLRDTVAHAMSYAINVQIKNYNEEYQNYVLHQYPRLYRNVPEIRYRNRIHEQLLYEGQAMDAQDSSIQLIHLGYTEEVIKKKKKTERNVRLLQEELRVDPHNGFMHFNLGNELMKTKELKKALKHYQIAHKNSNNHTVRTASALQIIKALTQLKEHTQALTILHEAKELYPDYTDLWYLEGEIFEELGREEEAKANFKICLQKGEAPKKYLSVSGVGSFYPVNKLATLSFRNRQFEQTLGYLTEMTDMNKYSYYHVQQIIGLLIPMFGKEKVIEFMHETYPSEQEKDLHFKNRLAHQFRLYREFSLLLPKSKHHFSKEDQDVLDFYLHIGEQEAKAFALQFAKESTLRHFALVYYLLTKDEDTKEALQHDKTCAFIISQLEGTNTHPKKNNYKKELYINTLKELMKIEQYAHVEALIPLALFFQPHAFVDIADLFVDYQQDDLAIEYYTKYLMTNKQDFSVYLKTARLLYHHGFYEEAMLFAEQAYKLNPVHFKPMEIILEACQKLKKEDTTKELAQHFLKAYPESQYLQEKAQ